MIYKLAEEKGEYDAFMKLTELAAAGAVCEIKKIVPGRSLKQNAYLHLILSYLGMEIGEPIDVVKTMYKMVNKVIYYREYTVFGTKFKAPRSSAELTKEEMTASIDTFREWSEKQGYPLPTATDQDWLISIQNRMEQEGYMKRSDT